MFRSKKTFKKWHLSALMIIVLFSVGMKLYSLRWPRAVVHIGNQNLTVLLADTNQHRFKGLSDRDNLGVFDGMLFLFPDRGQHGMVMRDMHFPLDIVWIDGDSIVDIAPNLAPEPGRTEAQLTPYFSRGASTLVLELPAGFVAKNGISVGDRVVVAY
jgi:uncharacterized protein